MMNRKMGINLCLPYHLFKCFDKIFDSCQDVNILWNYLSLEKKKPSDVTSIKFSLLGQS